MPFLRSLTAFLMTDQSTMTSISYNQMTQVEVKSTDVIKLILQFLKENNLHESFQALQRESKTTLNSIDTNELIRCIMQQRWDQLLQILNSLMLNEEHLFNVYQLMVDDLLEHDRYQAAEFIIKSCVKKQIKNITNFRERILRMEYIIENQQEKALHRKVVTEHRKKQVIKQCLFEIHQDVEPGRLLKLLTQAIKFQSQEGVIKPNIKLNLFEGRQKVVLQEQESLIKSVEKVVRYPQDAKINSLALSWGEELLALGGFDGLIEIYNTIDYTYHTGLKFQAEGTALFHDHPITIMEFNHSDDILASADTKGLVKLWNLENGKLLRKIQSDGVGSVCWGLDPGHLLLGHQDVKLYGVRACAVLKEYSVAANNDFVHKVLASENRLYVVTNSGFLKIFSYSTQEQLVSTNLRLPVLSVLPLYQSRGSNNIDRVLVVTPKRVVQLSRSGEEERKFVVETGELVGSMCVGEFLYEFIRADDKTAKLSVVSRSSGKAVYYCALDSQPQLLCMQRNKNLLVVYDSLNNLNFWRHSD